ncbi:MAG: hypothetical protein SGJ10_01815 [Bacteroidota bacterium]|nr:hypothetical protein [Bacteroidota bacterium]
MRRVTIFTVLFCLIGFNAKSQTKDSTKIKHHEVGIDMYPIAVYVLKPDAQGWFGGVPTAKPDYNFTYRYYFKNVAIKTRFSINQASNGESKTVTPSGNVTYTYISDAGYDKRYNTAVGFQYNIVQNKRSNAFIGVDWLNNKLGTSIGTWSQTNDTNINYIKINKSHHSNKTSTRISGIAFAFGVSFKLKQSLFFTIESSIRYIRATTKNKYGSYTYQYYEYNSQPQPIIEQNVNSANTTSAQTTEFVPSSNFTLSYRF